MDVGGFAVQVGKAALSRDALRVTVSTAARFFGSSAVPAVGDATAKATATAASDTPAAAHGTCQSPPGGAASLPLLLTPCAPSGPAETVSVWLRPCKGRTGPGRCKGEGEQQERYCELCGLGAWLRGQGAVPGVHWVQLWRGAGGALRLRLCHGQPTALPESKAESEAAVQQQQGQQHPETALKSCSPAAQTLSVGAYAAAGRPAAAMPGATVLEAAGEAAPSMPCGALGSTQKPAVGAETHVVTAREASGQPTFAEGLQPATVASQPHPLQSLGPAGAAGGILSPALLHCATAASLDAVPSVPAPPQPCPAPSVIAAPTVDAFGLSRVTPPGSLAETASAAGARSSAPARLQPGSGVPPGAVTPTGPSSEAPSRPMPRAGPAAGPSSPDPPPSAADAAAVLAAAAGVATRPQGGQAAAASPNQAPSLPASQQPCPSGESALGAKPSTPAAPHPGSVTPAPPVDGPRFQAVPQPTAAVALPPSVLSRPALPPPGPGHVLDPTTVHSGSTPLPLGTRPVLAPTSQSHVTAFAQPGLGGLSVVHMPAALEPREHTPLRPVSAPVAPCAAGPSPLVTLRPGRETGASSAAVGALGRRCQPPPGDAAVSYALPPGLRPPLAAGLAAATQQGSSRACLPERGLLCAGGGAGRASVLNLPGARQQQQQHPQQLRLPPAPQADGLARQLQQLQQEQQQLQQEQQLLQARHQLLQQWQRQLEVERQAQLQQRLRQQLRQRQQELQWQREQAQRRQPALQLEQHEGAWGERFAMQQLAGAPHAWPMAGGGAGAGAAALSGALVGDRPAGAHRLPAVAAARPCAQGQASRSGEAVVASAPLGGGPYSTGSCSPFTPLSGRGAQGGVPSLSPAAAASDAARCAQQRPQQPSEASALARRLSSVTPPATPHSALGPGPQPPHVSQRPQGAAGELREPHSLPLCPVPSSQLGEQPVPPQPQPVSPHPQPRSASRAVGAAAGDTGGGAALSDMLADAAAAVVAPAPAAAASNAPVAVAAAEGPIVGPRGAEDAAAVVPAASMGPHSLPAAPTPCTARGEEALPLPLGQARPRSPGLVTAWSLDSAAAPAKRLRTGTVLPGAAATTPLRVPYPSACRDGGNARGPQIADEAGGRHATTPCNPGTCATGSGPWRGGMEAPTCAPEPMRRAFSWEPQPPPHRASPSAAVPTPPAYPATAVAPPGDPAPTVPTPWQPLQQSVWLHGWPAPAGQAAAAAGGGTPWAVQRPASGTASGGGLARLPAIGVVLDEPGRISERMAVLQAVNRAHELHCLQYQQQRCQQEPQQGHREQERAQQQQQQVQEQQAGQPPARLPIGAPAAAPAAQQEDPKPEAPLLPAGLVASGCVRLRLGEVRRLWPQALVGKFPRNGVRVRLHILLGEGKERKEGNDGEGKEGKEGKQREEGEDGEAGKQGKEGRVGKARERGKSGSGKDTPPRGVAEQHGEGECKEFSVKLVVWHQMKGGGGGGSSSSSKKRCRGDGDKGTSTATGTTSATAATSTGTSAGTGGRYWALAGAEELLAALGASDGSHVSLSRLPDGRTLVRQWDEQASEGATWQDADFVPPPPSVPVFKVRVSKSAVYVQSAAVRELWPQACDLEPKQRLEVELFALPSGSVDSQGAVAALPGDSASPHGAEAALPGGEPSVQSDGVDAHAASPAQARGDVSMPGGTAAARADEGHASVAAALAAGPVRDCSVGSGLPVSLASAAAAGSAGACVASDATQKGAVNAAAAAAAGGGAASPGLVCEVEAVASTGAAMAAGGAATAKEAGVAHVPAGTPNGSAASGSARPSPPPEQPPSGEGVRITARLARTVQIHADGKRSHHFTLLGCSGWAEVLGRFVAGDEFSLERRDDGRVYVWRRPQQEGGEVRKPRRKRARRQEGEGAGQAAAGATTETAVVPAGGTSTPRDGAAPAATVSVVAGAKAPVAGSAPAVPAAAAAAAVPAGCADAPAPQTAGATVAVTPANVPVADGATTGALAAAGAHGDIIVEVCVD